MRIRTKLLIPLLLLAALFMPGLQLLLWPQFLATQPDRHFVDEQPRAELRSGTANCVEALLRWQPTGMDTVGPAQLIPLLEQTGLITEVGEWVLRESCRFIRDQLDAGLQPVNVSVNLSARQFRDPELQAKIERALNEYDVPANCLELELTEGVVMENTATAIRILDALYALGIRLSIDDFGTGYSSLGYLKRFPVDFLKIDRSFVHELPDDQDDAAIVRAIIALSRNLGISTVAEGVETEPQARFLANAGCDIAQGFLYSPLSERLRYWRGSPVGTIRPSRPGRLPQDRETERDARGRYESDPAYRLPSWRFIRVDCRGAALRGRSRDRGCVGKLVAGVAACTRRRRSATHAATPRSGPGARLFSRENSRTGSRRQRRTEKRSPRLSG
jgi:EAL domain-containing protein (putative c-di-GMP-specific phosphodiesterase class I)